MKKIVILLVICVVVQFCSFSEAKAEEVILAETKIDTETFTAFSVLGVDGNSYKAINDYCSVECESKFLIYGSQVFRLYNLTFNVVVYSHYEVLVINGTKTINATIVEEKKVEVETRNFQEFVSIKPYNDWVFVEISLNNTGFFFNFRTDWEDRQITKSYLDRFMENQWNMFLGIIVTVGGVVIARSTMKKGYRLPDLTDNVLVPAGTTILSFVCLFAGFFSRPPIVPLIFAGWFIFWTYFLCFIFQEDIDLINLDDMPNDLPCIVDCVFKDGQYYILKVESYVAFILRVLFGLIPLPAEIKDFVRIQKSHKDAGYEAKFRAFTQVDNLPFRELKYEPEKYSGYIFSGLIGVCWIIAGIQFSESGGDMSIFGYALIASIILFMVFIVKAYKVYQPDCNLSNYSKTGVKLWHESLKERISEYKQQVFDLSKKIDKNTVILDSIDFETLPKKDKKLRELRIKLNIARKAFVQEMQIVSEELGGALKTVKEIYETTGFPKELMTLNQAGIDIEALADKCSDLETKFELGVAIEANARSAKTLLSMANVLTQKDLQEKLPNYTSVLMKAGIEKPKKEAEDTKKKEDEVDGSQKGTDNQESNQSHSTGK